MINIWWKIFPKEECCGVFWQKVNFSGWELQLHNFLATVQISCFIHDITYFSFKVANSFSLSSIMLPWVKCPWVWSTYYTESWCSTVFRKSLLRYCPLSYMYRLVCLYSMTLNHRLTWFCSRHPRHKTKTSWLTPVTRSKSITVQTAYFIYWLHVVCHLHLFALDAQTKHNTLMTELKVMGILINFYNVPIIYVKYEPYLNSQKPSEPFQKGEANNPNTVNEACGTFPWTY